MKKFIYFIAFFFIYSSVSAESYIIQFQAKVKNLREFKKYKIQQLRSYELEGTFTDIFGN